MISVQYLNNWLQFHTKSILSNFPTLVVITALNKYCMKFSRYPIFFVNNVHNQHDYWFLAWPVSYYASYCNQYAYLICNHEIELGNCISTKEDGETEKRKKNQKKKINDILVVILEIVIYHTFFKEVITQGSSNRAEERVILTPWKEWFVCLQLREEEKMIQRSTVHICASL